MREITDENRAEFEAMRAGLSPGEQKAMDLAGLNLDLLAWAADAQAQVDELKVEYTSGREGSLLALGLLASFGLTLSVLVFLAEESLRPYALGAFLLCLSGPVLLWKRSQISDFYVVNFPRREIESKKSSSGVVQSSTFLKFADVHSLVLQCEKVRVKGSKRIHYNFFVDLVTQDARYMRWISLGGAKSGALRVGEKLAREIGVPFDASDPEHKVRVRRTPQGVAVSRIGMLGGMGRDALHLGICLLVISTLVVLGVAARQFYRGEQVSIFHDIARVVYWY